MSAANNNNGTDGHGDGVANSAGGLIVDDLSVGRSDDGQYLLLYAGQTLLSIYGAMGADPETVEFPDGSRFPVDELLDMLATR